MNIIRFLVNIFPCFSGSKSIYTQWISPGKFLYSPICGNKKGPESPSIVNVYSYLISHAAGARFAGSLSDGFR